MIWQRRSLIQMAFAPLTALSIAAPAAAQSMDELYAKAKAEGAVEFYSGGPIAPYERFTNEFEQRFPGHHGVDHRRLQQRAQRARSNEQLRGQEARRRHGVLPDRAGLRRLEAQGMLLDFKPDGFDQIAPNFRDPDGAYTTCKVNALTYAYNTALVAPAGRAEIGARFPQAACSPAS